jgi:HAD superfamily hydrolase (TIGR01509 family)
MIEAVIFDMDGVIVNSEPIYQKIEKEMFSELGIQVDADLYRTFVGLKTQEMWGIVVNRFHLAHHPADLDKEEEKRYLDSIYQKNGMLPVEGSIQLIRSVRNHGYLLALASSNSIRAIRAVMEKFKIDEYFSFVVSGDQVIKSKPDPEIFIKTAGLLRKEPENCLVIEDSSNGVNAARKAGMKCIAYENGDTGIQDLSEADLVVRDLRDITPDLFKIIFK